MNAFIQCCLKQQHQLARFIHNVLTVADTLTIYAKKNCGTSADNNIDLWLLFQMSELSGIAVEDLELCKVKFSKVEQFSLIMSNVIEKKKFSLTMTC